MLGKIPHEFPFPDYGDEKTRVDVLHTCIKMNQYFREHDAIAVCMRIFGQSYMLTDNFNCRRKKCLTPELLQKAEEMG